MNKSTKAALLSGLIFPGIGHFVLKQHLRGLILLVTATGATAVVVSTVVKQAVSIIDRVKSGEIVVDAMTVTDMVAQSSDATSTGAGSTAMIVLLICWLFGIVDSYRLGREQPHANE